MSKEIGKAYSRKENLNWVVISSVGLVATAATFIWQFTFLIDTLSGPRQFQLGENVIASLMVVSVILSILVLQIYARDKLSKKTRLIATFGIVAALIVILQWFAVV